jgi:hypothetical protein
MPLERTTRAANNFLSNRVGQAIGNINNPLLRDTAGRLLNRFLPGFGGGVPDLRDNAFREAINARYNFLLQETDMASQLQVSDPDGPGGNLAKPYDWRARLRPKNGGIEQFYQEKDSPTSYLMRPLKEAGGLIWPYTPTIFLSGTAEYNQALMQGMNYPINTFINSRPPDIPVTGDFTANDIYEARYLLAVLTFLKICTKAYFGDSAVAKGNAGTPPPVLLFEYLGDHGFNKVPVVVSNYSLQLPDSVDYVPVEVSGTVTYVPVQTNITITLTPTYTPDKLRRRFDLEAITSGRAYRDGFI